MVIDLTFVNHGLSGSNIQNSMLTLSMNNSFSKYKESEDNIAKYYVSIFDKLQQFSPFRLYERYNRKEITDSPFYIFMNVLYNKDKKIIADIYFIILLL